MVAILVGIAAALIAVGLAVAAYLRLASAPGRRISIEVDGHALNARQYGRPDPADPRPGIIFFSGWSPGTATWRPSDVYAGLCANRFSCVCITVSLRGMGSPGDIAILTRADFLDDALSAYDFLTSLDGVDSDRVIAAGESLGSYLACVLSSSRLIRALALRVPTDFPDEGFDDVAQERIAGKRSLEWKSQGHPHSESRALGALHDFSGDVLIVASQRDVFVPLQTTENYVASVRDSSRLTYRMMRGAKHGLISPLKQIEYVRILFGWMRGRV
jgi:pimeloyl-ACP methyl ester carboxylesterase